MVYQSEDKKIVYQSKDKKYEIIFESSTTILLKINGKAYPCADLRHLYSVQVSDIINPKDTCKLIRYYLKSCIDYLIRLKQDKTIELYKYIDRLLISPDENNSRFITTLYRIDE